jgi:hypothetical protein
MTKKNSSRLKLNKDTLRIISDRKLVDVNGGAGGRMCTDGSGCEKSTTCNR